MAMERGIDRGMDRGAVRACLIINPKSGRGGVDLSEALTVLQAHGWEVAVRRKLHGGHATELAQEAVRAGYNVVVDCGGDGTLNEIVEGVVGTDAAIGTLPGGTANLWAHETGISRNLGVAALQLVSAERRRVDVGQVTVNGKHKQHFVLMAGLGIDGAILTHLSKTLKNRIGKLAYAPALVRAMPELHAVPVRLEMDGLHWQGQVSQVIVGNTRRYASFTRITPDAYADDGLLDICLISARGPLSAARQLTTLALRQRPSPASAQTYRAANITLTAPVVLPLQVDGGSVDLDEQDDLTAEGVIYRFTLLAQSASVLIPRTYDGELFRPTHTSDALIGVPLRPVAEEQGASHNGNGHGKGGKEGKEKRWRVEVTAVGADTITAVKAKNGRAVRLVVDTDTTLSDGDGGERQLWGALSAVTAGDTLEVRGRKGDAPGTLIARRVEIADADTSRRRKRG
jgi:YegS/Rv2252/BmrU family lipid kinase